MILLPPPLALRSVLTCSTNDKLPTATLSDHLFSRPLSLFFRARFNPAPIRHAQFITFAHTQQLHQCPSIDQSISPGRFLDLSIIAMRPFGRVLNHHRPHPIQIHVHNAPYEVMIRFYRRCMIAVLPIGTFSTLVLIVFLSRTPCRQLNQAKGSQRGHLYVATNAASTLLCQIDRSIADSHVSQEQT